MTIGQPAVSARKVGILLGIGIFFLPIIFAWFTLRRGYSKLARIVSLGWMALWLVIGALGQGAPPPSSVKTTPRATTVQEKTAEEIEAERLSDLRKQYERNPATALTLEASGEKGGFDTVLIISGTLTNAADFAVKDVRIECELFGNSGTRVGRVSQTLFEIVPANGSKSFRELNMGFMGGAGQVSTYRCEPNRAVKQ